MPVCRIPTHQATPVDGHVGRDVVLVRDECTMTGDSLNGEKGARRASKPVRYSGFVQQACKSRQNGSDGCSVRPKHNSVYKLSETSKTSCDQTQVNLRAVQRTSKLQSTNLNKQRRVQRAERLSRDQHKVQTSSSKRESPGLSVSGVSVRDIVEQIVLSNILRHKKEEVCELGGYNADNCHVALENGEITTTNHGMEQSVGNKRLRTVKEQAEASPFLTNQWGLRTRNAASKSSKDEQSKRPAMQELTFDKSRKDHGFIRLGKGAFGFVYKARYRGMDVAVKMTSRPLAKTETEALRALKSSHVIRLYKTIPCAPNNQSWLIVERCTASLETVVSAKGALTPSSVQYLMACLALALDHLHSVGWAHLDIKLGNILINKMGRPKLCDFGSAKNCRPGQYFEADECYPVGSDGYWAPEIVRREPYNCMADWFSFGVVMYKLLSGRLPWLTNDLEMLYRIDGGQMDFDDAAFDKNSKDLIGKFLVGNPCGRWGNSLAAIRAHRWFRGVLWMKLEKGRVRPTQELQDIGAQDFVS